MPEASTARPALDKKKSIILGILWVAVIVFIFLRVIPQVGSSYKEAVTALESMSAGAVACIVLSLLVYLLVMGFLSWQPPRGCRTGARSSSTRLRT